jgi:hypothetical protein
MSGSTESLRLWWQNQHEFDPTPKLRAIQCLQSGSTTRWFTSGCWTPCAKSRLCPGRIIHNTPCTVILLRYGAGIKGNVLDNLAHGLPCVVSEVAAEELELPEDLSWPISSVATATAWLRRRCGPRWQGDGTGGRHLTWSCR